MSKKDGDASVYRDRARKYVDRLESGKSGGGTRLEDVVAHVPVELWKDTFVDVDKIPSEDDLPPISERLRDFATRLVLEGWKPDRVWAELFGVTLATIGRWRRNPDVAMHIAFMRHRYRGYMLARKLHINRLWMDALSDLLSLPTNSKTGPVIMDAIKFAASLTSDMRMPVDHNKGSNFAVSVGMYQGSGMQSDIQSPFRHERDVTPDEIEDMSKELDRKITELDMVLDLKRIKSDFEAVSGSNGDDK